MAPSQHLIDFLKKEEGCILHPYLDQASVWTIGIGTTHYPDGKAVTASDPPITLSQAMQYVLTDVKDASLTVNKAVKDIPVTQNMFDSLTSFTYNVGSGGFQGSTLLKLIRKNYQDPRIKVAFGMWNKIRKNGKVVVSEVLTGRRKREAILYFTP